VLRRCGFRCLRRFLSCELLIGPLDGIDLNDID